MFEYQNVYTSMEGDYIIDDACSDWSIIIQEINPCSHSQQNCSPPLPYSFTPRRYQRVNNISCSLQWNKYRYWLRLNGTGVVHATCMHATCTQIVAPSTYDLCPKATLRISPVFLVDETTSRLLNAVTNNACTQALHTPMRTHTRMHVYAPFCPPLSSALSPRHACTQLSTSVSSHYRNSIPFYTTLPSTSMATTIEHFQLTSCPRHIYLKT